nr:biosynthetic-type acetolactate synthase large subunit [uncultured Catonella sp.]
MAELSGSQILVECLKEQGVDTIFGYPGGAVLNLYDELYRHQDEIKHILTSHEQGAAHAADGYARSTGKVGVCLATSGPGATNLVTGIANAYMDSVPIVAITGNVGTNLLGKDSFQEVDIAGVTMPITKHNFIVKDVKKLAKIIRRAFKIASTGRPGPVLIDITKDVTANKCEYKKEEIKKAEKKKIGDNFTDKELDKAAEMIAKAKRPVIFVGGGAIISEAHKEIKTLVELMDAPVCDSLMGKGAFDGTDKRYMGMIGMHGTKTANFSVTECDLLVVLGARFSDRVTGNTRSFAKRAKILHIDIDPAEINKNVKVDLSIEGDVKDVVRELNKKIETQSHEEWMEHIGKMQAKFPLRYNEAEFTGQYFIEELYKLTKGDAVISTEVGQHQMWAAQFYKYSKPRTLLTSGGLGTMGYGLGAAIGAQIGCPKKQVINLAGDGCFRMNMNELATAAHYNIPIIEVVFNNNVLGMVRQWQTLFYGKRYSQTMLSQDIDYVKLAEAMSITAFRVTKKEEVEEVIGKALKAKGPVFIEVVIDRNESVWPMVPAGATLEETFSEEDVKEKEAKSKK